LNLKPGGAASVGVGRLKLTQRLSATQVLVLGMSSMQTESKMHNQQLSQDCSLGTRGCSGAYAERLDRTPEASKPRRQTVEHAFGTLKAWMRATHFLTRTLPRASAEMSLHVLAYNLKRMMQIFGAKPLMKAMTG
jgi:hypothetical protein